MSSHSFSCFLCTCHMVVLFIFTSCTNPQPEKPEAVSNWMINDFAKVDSLNPVLTPSSDQRFSDPLSGREMAWESRNVLNPAAIVRNDTVFLFYRAQDPSGTSRIGLAVSTDGLHFSKLPEPVFYPDEDMMKPFEWSYLKEDDPDCGDCFDGVEDPRIVETPDGKYIMTYTAYDGRTARMALASSANLTDWEKHGLILSDSIYANIWSKSGAILTERTGNRIVAKKVNGSYWMYYGDTDIFMATSQDLIHWEPLINEESNQRVQVMHPRAGYFDSRLVEPGPFALYTPKGIIFLYNGSNAANANDPELPKFTYAAGQALFSNDAPYKLIDRAPEYFIYPEEEYEISGEVNLVCFIEGLVYFRNQWFLYYGTADSRIAVAVAPGN